MDSMNWDVTVRTRREIPKVVCFGILCGGDMYKWFTTFNLKAQLSRTKWRSKMTWSAIPEKWGFFLKKLQYDIEAAYSGKKQYYMMRCPDLLDSGQGGGTNLCVMSMHFSLSQFKCIAQIKLRLSLVQWQTVASVAKTYGYELCGWYLLVS